MDPLFIALLGLVTASVTALVTWRVSTRQRSGRIETSEAADLWVEGKALREEQRAEIISLRSEVLAMRNEAITIRIEAAGLREESVLTREEAAATRVEMVTLREASAACHKELTELQALLATKNQAT